MKCPTPSYLRAVVHNSSVSNLCIVCKYSRTTCVPVFLIYIFRDLESIYKDPPYGICVVPNNDDITQVSFRPPAIYSVQPCTILSPAIYIQIHAIITGPFDTPYEGGLFHFLIRFPPNYPFSPPRVKFLTTGGGRVRFNPNLYQNGKVCLSILG